MIICYKSESDEEWYQEEYQCAKCGVLFMYADYHYDESKPQPEADPHYCPNCGCKFEAIYQGDAYEFLN